MGIGNTIDEYVSWQGYVIHTKAEFWKLSWIKRFVLDGERNAWDGCASGYLKT
jgi:hypothetical protein